MTPQQKEQAGEDLAKAAAYIREHGWTHGGLENRKGQVCALGAINAVVMGSATDVPSVFTSNPEASASRAKRAVTLLAKRIKQCFPNHEAATQPSAESVVWTFNDSSNRMKPKVLKVLDGECES